MFSYRTETHCHTLETSRCGKIPAKDVVNAYIKAGYHTLLITDHFGGKHASIDRAEYDVNHFMEGYRAAKLAADGRINVILGMEINLCENANDYLVYGDVERFLSNNPECYKLSLPDFCDLAHENGMLVYQAHPFRNNITVVNPDPLDGIEVFNSHPRHNSRNSIARAWAELHKKPMISGSDAHQEADLARSGILTETEIKSAEEFLNVLKSKNYQLITI